jgi:hypothetical protein
MSLNVTQRFEFRNVIAQSHLDAQVEGHVGTWTLGAHPGQPDISGVAVDADQFDVAAVSLQEGPNPLENAFDLLFSDHRCLLSDQPEEPTRIPTGQWTCQSIGAEMSAN